MVKYITLICSCLLLAITSPANAGESLVATHSIRAGTILTAADVTLKEFEVSGAATSPEEVIGLEVRRNLYAGRPVLLAELGPPTLVRRNEKIMMTYRLGGLIIKADGRALEAGGEGEIIRVLNRTSRTTLFATVTGPKSVDVTQ